MSASRVPESRALAVLQRALEEGGRILRHYTRRPFRVTHKGVVDLATTADHASERAVQKAIRRAFPDHGFLMEESGEHPSASPYRWIVDPLDGTVNFAHGLPLSCVSIALEERGRTILGGVLDPFRREMFLARRGRGARMNGRRLRVSGAGRLIDALLVTGFPYDRQRRAAYYLSFVRRFMTKAQGIRRLGAAALDLAYVAAGRFDGYWEFNLKPWDAAAGRLLVEEAGGRVSDFAGRAYSLADTSQTLASNGRLHAALLRELRGARRAPTLVSPSVTAAGGAGPSCAS